MVPILIRSTPVRSQRARCTMSTMERSEVSKVEWLADPILVKGAVQRGFGRGSRDLGTPTANLPGKLLDGVRQAERDGVYVGFGSVPKHHGEASVKMVANLGRNITYGDVEARVLEAYLMENSAELPTEFYGDEMRLCIIGYLRPELKFDGIKDLMDAINNDIRVANAVLDDKHAAPYRRATFFK